MSLGDGSVSRGDVSMEPVKALSDDIQLVAEAMAGLEALLVSPEDGGVNLSRVGLRSG